MNAVSQKQIGLVDIPSLASHLSITEKAVRNLATRRKIPVVRLGYKTLRFSIPDVEQALAKLTTKAI